MKTDGFADGSEARAMVQGCAGYGFLKGGILLLLTATAWGGMFPVAKDVLRELDAFYLTSIRYGTVALVFLALLAIVEGPRAFRFEGRGRRLFFFGSMGFAGFSLFVLVGLTHARAEHGAIIMALMPLITAMVNWLWKGIRPANFTLACIAAALFGVFLVITRGQPASLLAGDVGVSELLILVGAASWVVYTLGAGAFRGWSPLRYTALSCALGMLSVLAATGIATLTGHVHPPTLQTVASVGWGLGYIIVFASVFAVVAWNAGIGIVGPLNGVLFINAVPITAFAIGIALGHEFRAAEVLGAAITIGALVANNLYARRAARAAASARASSVRESAT